MARHHKSDDSGDDDFDPHRPSRTDGKSKKSSTKKKQKAGALEVRPPQAQPFFHNHNSPQFHDFNVNAKAIAFGGFLPIPDPTPTDLSFASQLAAYEQQKRDSVVSPGQYAVQPLLPAEFPGYQEESYLQSPFVIEKPVSYSPAFKLKGMLQFDDEVLDGQLHFTRRGPGGHTSRDTADIWLVELVACYEYVRKY